MSVENFDVRHMEHTNRMLRRRVPVPQQEPIVEILANNSKDVFLSILIICLRIQVLSTLKDLFSYFGEVLDYDFIKFADIQDNIKAIEYINGKIIGDCKLQVTWARFQKHCYLEGERRIPKVKNIPNQDMSFPYKQALLSYPTGNELEAQKGANEAMEEHVHDHLIYVGKLTSQVPSCGSSMEDNKEIDSSLHPFDDPLEMELQLHEKSEKCKFYNKAKRSGSKN
ncbi:hypothetical protein Cgig2_023086 [Carnegiea gigantea]|uniref:RRM domain-containing protein n=1 Tax=Carnegiea gigantea TaxID=171969 RepID=A0A9Q1GLL8_9CARY|nr:hypothetical protein Cgig2_023086 [Carnegiea gigantea]